MIERPICKEIILIIILLLVLYDKYQMHYHMKDYEALQGVITDYSSEVKKLEAQCIELSDKLTRLESSVIDGVATKVVDKIKEDERNN